MKAREIVMIVALCGVIVGSASAAGLIPPPQNEACPTIYSDYRSGVDKFMGTVGRFFRMASSWVAFQVTYD